MKVHVKVSSEFGKSETDLYGTCRSDLIKSVEDLEGQGYKVEALEVDDSEYTQKSGSTRQRRNR